MYTTIHNHLYHNNGCISKDLFNRLAALAGLSARAGQDMTHVKVNHYLGFCISCEHTDQSDGVALTCSTVVGNPLYGHADAPAYTRNMAKLKAATRRWLAKVLWQNEGRIA